MSVKSSYIVFIFISVVLTGQFTSSANILVWMLLGSHSHRLSMWPLVQDLAKAGHNVTFLSPFNKHPDPKVTDVVPKLWASRLGDWADHIDFHELRRSGKLTFLWAQLPGFGAFSCESFYEDDEVVQWIRNADRFDLVIVDTLFNECAYGMVHHWNSKLIIYATANQMGWFQDQFGMPDETSSLTDSMFGFPPGKEMSFGQRFINEMMPLVWTAARNWHILPRLEEISRRGLEKVTGKKVDLPSFAVIERNADLVFITSHHSMSFPRSLPPNFIAIGGLSVPEKIDPLPRDLQDFIGNKKDDQFIFVSLGSIVEFPKFPEETQRNFIDALKAFPNMKFIWKSNMEINQSLPKNFKVVQWAPQMALLAHPKIKGFITHSGLGSTTEAIVFGVPIVMFPIFAEQDMNAGLVESRGAGIKLEITDVKKDVMEHAIKEILENPSYKKAMQRLSDLFKDRPMPARKLALWWTEFVLRHDTTIDFLRPPSVEQNWWVKRQIDVWLVAAFLLTLITALPTFVLYKVLSKVLCGSTSNTNKIAKMSNRKKTN